MTKTQEKPGLARDARKNKAAGRNPPQSRSRIPVRNSREGTDDSGIGSTPSTPSEPTAAQTAASVSQVVEYKEVVSVLDILRTKDDTITKLKRELERVEKGKAEALNESKQAKRDLELRTLRLDLEKEEFKVQGKGLRQKNFDQEEKIDRVTEQLRQERTKNSTLKLEAAKTARLIANLARAESIDEKHGQDIIGLKKERDELTAKLESMAKELDECKANVRVREDELDRLSTTMGADRTERADLNDKLASQHVSTVPAGWKPPKMGAGIHIGHQELMSATGSEIRILSKMERNNLCEPHA